MWIPGSFLIFPLHVLRLARLPAPSLVRAAAGAMLATLWFAADQGLCYHRYCFEMTRWVDTHSAPDLELIESVRRGEYFDYADIDLVGDRLVAVAEQTHRLLSLDLDGRILGTHALPEKWMPPALGSVFDSASDPERGVTYYLGGPHHLEGLRWAEGGWAETIRSREFSIETGFAGYYLPQVRAGGPKMILRRPAHPGLLHVAMAWSPERERVFAVTIDPRKPSDYPLMVSASPDLQEVEVLNLRTAEGLLLPTPREILWLPPLDALVVAPDFWDTLYLVDPVHGLFVTATIFTGTVLVQRLDDGGVVDLFHGAMPMVRKLVLQPERGVAFLTTWSALYRFSYLRRWEPVSGEE